MGETSVAVVPFSLTGRGTFLGWDQDKWTDPETKEQKVYPVLVIAKESRRFTQAIRVPAAQVASVEMVLADAEDRVITFECFAGDYRRIVLVKILEIE